MQFDPYSASVISTRLAPYKPNHLLFSNHSEADYINRYCRSRNAKKQFNSDSRGASHTAELHVILAGSLMIRRLKKDVLVLPKKKRTVVEVAGDGAGLQVSATIPRFAPFPT